MIRKIAFLTIILILLSFNGCGEGGVYNDDGQKAEARLKQVIEAVENHDKDVLRSMFSEQALNEAEDLDGRMEYLFGFVQGDIKAWEMIGGGGGGVNNYGHAVLKSRYWYTVKTDKEDYLFFLYEYTEDTDHPDNVGLYMLQVIKAGDRHTQFDGGQDILCPGIYRPEETDVEVSEPENQ